MTKMLRPRYWCTAVAVGLSLCALSTPASALGTQATPNGLADFMAGVLPPPGTYWLNYVAYVSKNALMNEDGKKVEITVGLPDGDEDEGTVDVTAKSKLKASAVVEAARFVWMTPAKFLGANYGMQVIFPFYTADMNLKFKVPAGPVTDPFTIQAVKDKAKGLGDIVVNPIILAWHFSPNFHMGAGLDIVLPTGRADSPAAGLLCKNVLTFEPLVAVSYWQPGGLDVSAKIMYDFHGSNRDTETVPGQEFHFDFGASWGFGQGDQFRAGLAGFAYFQTTADSVRGDKLDSDTKSRQIAAGPAFKWWPGMGPFSVEGKAMWEFATKNDAKGYTVWLDTVLAL